MRTDPAADCAPKTLVDIDDTLLAKAAKALGTSTNEDTVNQALAQVARSAAAESLIEFAREGGFDDLLDPELMKAARRH